MTSMLEIPLPAVNDPEGDRPPENFPPVIDAHVHLFPDSIFSAIWKWFGQYGWPIRYRMPVDALLEFMFARGVSRIVALTYAHKPGIAGELNRFMAETCLKYPGRITGLGTVFPGEPGAGVVIDEAFRAGLAGIKLHAHVQCFDMNGPEMEAIYSACASAGRPLVMHVGKEPKSPAYPCDPYELCGADKLERALVNYPSLKICVPHLGGDEFAAYRCLIEKYDNLWLDTAMVLTDYLPMKNRPPLKRMRIERIMYGSDFPNIPYAWDRELKALAGEGLSEEQLRRVLSSNAEEFFSI